jgi:hypothetical protein
MDRELFVIYIPTDGTAMGAYFYSLTAEKELLTHDEAKHACAFQDSKEAQRACDDLNRHLKRPLGTANHPSCYVCRL